MTRRIASPQPHKRADGFALILVIWGLGVISLLVVSFMTTSRLRIQAANSVAGGAQATAAAEGVTNLAIMQLLKERETLQGQAALAAASGAGDGRPVYDGAPRFCAFAGAAVALSVEDETGKIDLNAAAPELLKAALIGLGEAPARADAITASIIAFRTQPDAIGARASSGEKPFPPKNALFQTVLELDQVEGVDSALFRRFAPLLTVYSRSPGINPAAAPPALLGAFLGLKPVDVDQLLRAPFPNALARNDPRFPTQFKSAGGASDAFLVRAETMLPGGQASGRETIVDFSGANALGGSAGVFVVREIRRSPSRFSDVLRNALAQGALRPC